MTTISQHKLQVLSCLFSLTTLGVLLSGVLTRSTRQVSEGSQTSRKDLKWRIDELDELARKVTTRHKQAIETNLELRAESGARKAERGTTRRRLTDVAASERNEASFDTTASEIPVTRTIYPESSLESGPISEPMPVAPESDFTGDPLLDYVRARQLGGPDAEAAFKKAYAPCISVSCTNLAQRTLPDVRFMFRPASRASFLIATTGDGRSFLLPQFGTEYPFARSLMEGPFIYPPGDLQELRLVKAGELRGSGEDWLLVERGAFSA